MIIAATDKDGVPVLIEFKDEGLIKNGYVSRFRIYKCIADFKSVLDIRLISPVIGTAATRVSYDDAELSNYVNIDTMEDEPKEFMFPFVPPLASDPS